MTEKTFVLPDLGEGLIDATVLDWLVSPGDHVERNQPLVELDTSKSALELPSPQSGRIVRTFGQPGDTLNVGDPLVVFEVDDDQAGIVGTVPESSKKSRRRVRLSLPPDVEDQDD